MPEGDTPSPAITLWDLPVRLVHWSFVALIPVLWWSAENGNLDLHKPVGYVMLALVVFRLIWGVIGSSSARFASFVRGPGAVLRYLRGESGTVIGHNPVGALSVVLLLTLLGAQIGLGLFAQDVDGLESGPLSYLVSYDTADLARELHEIGFNLILAVIAIHVAAIAYYRVIKRDDLITPMVTGKRAYESAVEAPTIAPWWRVLISAAIAGGIAWWVALGAPLPGGS
jgi:cytochrome b